MGKLKSKIVWTIITIALAGVSIWAVSSQSKDFSFWDFLEYIHNSNPLFLVLAILCMVLFVVFEALSVLRIIKGFGYKRKLSQGLVYSASDIYFSAITPSATGGQPACGFFMVGDSVPGGIVTGALILNLILYTLSIMILGIVAIIIDPTLFFNFSSFSKTLIVLGYIILGGLTFFFILILRSEKILHGLCSSVVKLLHKIKILKNINEIENKLSKAMDDYATCAGMIKGQKKMVIEALIYNLAQRLSLICVPGFVFLAMGGSFAQSVDVWVTQVLVTMGSNYIPIPGAMGVIDYLLMDGVGGMMSQTAASNLDLLSRGVSFYSCVLICGIIMIIGYIVQKRRNSRVQ